MAIFITLIYIINRVMTMLLKFELYNFCIVIVPGECKRLFLEMTRLINNPPLGERVNDFAARVNPSPRQSKPRRVI